jgi:CRISPR/Cas system-associated exonuclease Cas4 (RecB family)
MKTDISTIAKRQDLALERVQNDEPDVCVGVAKVASQFYCEKQLQLQEEHGDRTTPEMEAGQSGHEAAYEGAEEVTREEFWSSVAEEPSVTTFESSLCFELNDDLTIVGRPDAVHFRDGVPRVVVERKFARTPENLYDNHKVQAWLYSFLLDKAGFDVSELRSLILRFPSDFPRDADAVQSVEQLAIEQALSTNESELPRRSRVLKQFDAWSHIRPYDPVKWLNELDHALDYWRGERPAVPTDVAIRCQYCDYENVCPESKT